MVDANLGRYPRPILIGTLAAILSGIAALASTGAVAQSQAPATLLSRIALLVDTSDSTVASITQIRAGLQAFVDALPPEPELLVATTGRRTAVRLQPTTDRKKARESVGGLTPDGGPTPLIDSLLEIDERFMRKAPDRRAIFVLVTGDGTESSRGDPDTFNKWLATLRNRQASAHALVIKTGNGMPEVVARAIAQATSGLFQTINPGASITGAMQQIAARIAAHPTR